MGDCCLIIWFGSGFGGCLNVGDYGLDCLDWIPCGWCCLDWSLRRLVWFGFGFVGVGVCGGLDVVLVDRCGCG